MEKTGLILIIVQIVAKVFGFMREVVLSNTYGASNISDAYLIANSLPIEIFGIVSVGVTAGFIPLYNRVEIERGLMEADKFTANLMNLLFVFSLIICVLVIVFARPIVRLFALGFDQETLGLAVGFTQITILGIVFLSMNAVMVPYLNVKHHFVIPSMVGIPASIGIVGGILLSEQISIQMLAIGTLIGFFLQTVLLVPSLSAAGFTHRPILRWSDPFVKSMIMLSIPMIVGTSANQVNFLVDRTIASTLEVGAISALNYASRLNGFAHGLFIFPVITLLYPRLSKLALEKDVDQLNRALHKGMIVISILVVPVTIGGMMLSKEVVSILFMRGAFDERALLMTTAAVSFYLIGIIGLAYKEIFSRVYFSFGNTWLPVRNTLITVGVNIVLNIILSALMGLAGLALATSLSNTITAYLSSRGMKNHLPKSGLTRPTILNIGKIFGSGMLMAVSLFFMKSILPQEVRLSTFLLEVLVGGLTFITGLIVLKVDEMQYFSGLLTSLKK